MSSLSRDFFRGLRFKSPHLASLRALGEYKGKQGLFANQSPEALATLKSLAMVESTISSNRMEGIVVGEERARDIVLKATAPMERPEQEVAGYRDALSLVHASFRDLPFSTRVIRQLHSTICRYLPESGGHWKKEDNLIFEHYPDGTRRIRFTPVSARRTEGAMQKLVEEYNLALADGAEPLVAIPLAIFDFLCIHPFMDGNGRVSRLLTLLLLYQAGYDVGRYISLERIAEESRESYYEALEKSSKGWHSGAHDVFPWLTYFWGILLRAYKEFEERVGTVTTGRGAKTEQVELAVRRKIAPFSISDIERECPGISRDLIRKVMRKMRDAGEIRSTGLGRGAKWIKTGVGDKKVKPEKKKRGG